MFSLRGFKQPKVVNATTSATMDDGSKRSKSDVVATASTKVGIWFWV